MKPTHLIWIPLALTAALVGCGDKDATDDSVPEADTDTDTDTDTDSDSDADADTDSDSDTDACTGTATGGAADAFAQTAGTWTFSQVSAGDQPNSPWTQGVEYDVVVDASGTVTYDTDGGEMTCCWDGSTFDVIYGEPGSGSDLNIVMAEDDNSNCALNWSGATEVVSRFSIMNAAYETYFLY